MKRLNDYNSTQDYLNALEYDKLTNHDIEIQKMINISYSPRRNELYVHDFNNKRLFTIDLYELKQENENHYNFIMQESQHGYFDKVAAYIVYKDIIIEMLDSLYPDLNITFKTFEICNFKDYDSDFLYLVNVDYMPILAFGSDEDDALIIVSDFLSRVNYHNEVDAIYYGITKIE